MHYEKVIMAPEDKDNPNWDGHYYNLVGQPQHTFKCNHHESAFGEHCDCGALEKEAKLCDTK